MKDLNQVELANEARKVMNDTLNDVRVKQGARISTGMYEDISFLAAVHVMYDLEGFSTFFKVMVDPGSPDFECFTDMLLDLEHKVITRRCI